MLGKDDVTRFLKSVLRAPDSNQIGILQLTTMLVQDIWHRLLATEDESSLFKDVAAVLHITLHLKLVGNITVNILLDHMTNTACDNIELPLKEGLILPFLLERLEAKALEHFEHQKDTELVSLASLPALGSHLHLAVCICQFSGMATSTTSSCMLLEKAQLDPTQVMCTQEEHDTWCRPLRTWPCCTF